MSSPPYHSRFATDEFFRSMQAHIQRFGSNWKLSRQCPECGINPNDDGHCPQCFRVCHSPMLAYLKKGLDYG